MKTECVLYNTKDMSNCPAFEWGMNLDTCVDNIIIQSSYLKSML